MKESFKTADYSHLEGKIIEHTCYNGGVEKLRVVGIDYSIGITICSADDPNDNRICLNGKLSPHYDPLGGWPTTEERTLCYDNMFKYLISAIENGVSSSKELGDAKYAHNPKLSLNLGNPVLQCAFST